MFLMFDAWLIDVDLIIHAGYIQGGKKVVVAGNRYSLAVPQLPSLSTEQTFTYKSVYWP